MANTVLTVTHPTAKRLNRERALCVDSKDPPPGAPSNPLCKRFFAGSRASGEQSASHALNCYNRRLAEIERIPTT
jgi:hypothetical protein